MTIPDKLEKNLIFAHRGASTIAPENTLPAFKLAMELGADGVELDVILTKDKQLAVVHDFELDRTSSIGGTVQEMTLEEIKKVDAGSWFDEEFKGVQIPTLQEVFDLIGGKMLINIELKMRASEKSRDLAEAVINLVRKNNLEHSVIYSSFNPYPLFYIKWMDKNASVALLSMGNFLGKTINFFFGKLLLHPNAYHLNHELVTSRWISSAHRKMLKVRSYTVNDMDEMKKFFEWGIDGIFTDNLQMALSIRDGDK